MGQSDAGGGSTLTMQVVKNTYTSTESSGIQGIIRKFTDIYMAVFKVEKSYTIVYKILAGTGEEKGNNAPELICSLKDGSTVKNRTLNF